MFFLEQKMVIKNIKVIWINADMSHVLIQKIFTSKLNININSTKIEVGTF